ncbi:S-adenosyl-L-methionine-dependent methyltransferase [Suillus subalutaceus]|uniref:S-adenosyl-L-methionine-dependent methyltransferase n=1 Tax=Suillus subalutaceus TaxID=48586 RepID=UPI001B865A4B|nr:S-adenosyl-L-methionine-dependent methyltransferase [Suillus subalutaceus]KAG1877596.1 S-adenosyl-L-methionine-dependent methyltransferase [Suillus subalutaceus]
MMTSVHPNAQAGFATGTSESYDRWVDYFPGPYSLILLIWMHLGFAPRIQPIVFRMFADRYPRAQRRWKIVEIGAGTGIFTRALLTHPEWATSIGTLRAIEPSEGMRNYWTKCVQDHRCTIVNGTFDNTGVEDGWADLIIISHRRAFHWCLDYGKAFTEFARILNKDGAAVFVCAAGRAAGWVAQVQHCIEARGNGSPRFRLDVLRQAFSTPEYTSLFHPQEEKQWAHHGDRVLSWSYIAVLPPDEKAKVAEGIKVILERGDGKVWINKEQGHVSGPAYGSRNDIKKEVELVK